MNTEQTAFQIHKADHVATALGALIPGTVTLYGETTTSTIECIQTIATGHKIALNDILVGQDILKYGVVIGRATTDIPKGSWVHLHCIQSLYDERSSHLDVVTGTPTDIIYE